MITKSAVRGTSTIVSLSCVPRSATALPGRFLALGGVGAHFGAPQSAKPTRGAARLRRAVSERGGLGGPFGAPHSFVAQDQPGVSRRLVDRHAGGPVRAELRGNAEPAHPLLAHRRRLVGPPQHVDRQRPDRRPEGRQRDTIDRRPRGLREQEPYLLPAAPALAGAHARAREPLDLILVERPVAQQGGDAAGAHLRRLPVEIARRLRSEEHTSELQSRGHLVCRLLLEKKKKKKK